MMKVEVYTEGLLHCSVCAPNDMTADDVVREVNQLHHPGTMNGWELDGAGVWASGVPMPSPCTDKPETHTHYLLTC